MINTTFSVFDGTKEMHSFRNYPQAFPGTYPADSFPARTGAVENDTLGYFEGDSVYHLSFEFTHSTGSLTLNFTGTFPAVDPEEWGIDNIVVTAVPEPSTFLLAFVALCCALHSAAICSSRYFSASHGLITRRPFDSRAKRSSSAAVTRRSACDCSSCEMRIDVQAPGRLLALRQAGTSIKTRIGAS